MMNELLTTMETAQLIKCDPKTVLNAMYRGDLVPSGKRGKGFLFLRSDIETFLTTRHIRYYLKDKHEQIISDYLSGMSGIEIANKHGSCRSAIYGILYAEGVPMRSSSQATRTYSADFRFFQSVQSEPQAYWLGFIAADGSINTRRTKYGLIINLHISDKAHLELFRDTINGNHPIKEYQRTCTIQIHSESLINDLSQYGIIPRKARRLRFPNNLPRYLIHHFIRGYFDGDGSIWIDLKGQLRFSIAGNYHFLKILQNKLVNNCQVGCIKIYQCSNTPYTFQLSYGGNRQVPRILDYLYYNATTFLERKAIAVAPYLSSSIKTAE